MPGWFLPGSRALDHSCSSRATHQRSGRPLHFGNGRRSSLCTIRSFDGLTPSHSADIEVETVVVEGVIVASFVVLTRVGVVVERLRFAFLDLRWEQVAEALVDLLDQVPVADVNRLGGLVVVGAG